MGRFSEGISALLPKVAGDPAGMMQLAKLMLKDEQTGPGVTLCRQAMALAPGDAALMADGRFVLNSLVPQWHFALVADSLRNQAYEAALRRAIKPGMRVLEIGTGTGILAMMAARAGAADVVTCEMNPVVAETARSIIAQNGYADRVRVFADHSCKLTLDELGGQADILVSEIISADLLSEGVLPAHEKAVAALVKPGAAVIPARGRVRVALAEDRGGMKNVMGEVDGFDLSPFNALRMPLRRFHVGDERLALRSDPQDLFAFDFADPRYCAPGSATITCRAAGGRINGIAQWIALDLDADTTHENRPGPGAESSWASMFYTFPTPIDTVPGQEIRIAGSHNRHTVMMWMDG